VALGAEQVAAACAVVATALAARAAGWSGRARAAARTPPAVGARPRWTRPVRSPPAPAPRDLVVALEAMEAAVGAGCSLGQAVEQAAEAGGVGLGVAASGIRRGAGTVASLDRWAASMPGTGAEVVADAVAIAVQAGAAFGPALREAAATVREREAIAREARALASQARASAAVLVAAPLAFSAGACVLDPAVRAFLLGSPAGCACLVVGALLDAAGARWMAALIEGVR
jgi:tight adherence protein B